MEKLTQSCGFKSVRNQQTPTEAWVRQETFSLQGRVSGWYHNLRMMKDRLTWGQFSEECKICFGPPMSMNPLGELTRLRQTGSVEDFCESYESLLGRTTGVSHEQSIWHFCAGLTNAIRYEVEFARSATLYYAMNLARQIEFKLAEEGRPRSFGPPITTGSKPATVNKNRESAGTGGTGGAGKTVPRNPAWKRLTAREMDERRAKGLCFNCDDLFSIGHKCAKLFCIMLADEGELDEDSPTEDDTPKIYLNAIRGEKTNQTFQVQAVIGTGLAWVLLDMGSTHNFIAKRSAERLQILVHHRPGLCVALPDGGKMASNGISKDLHMAVQGCEFSADFFSIPLEGFDMVLGICWLQGLGQILWDFKVREMEFTMDGRPIKWHGETPNSATLATLTHHDETEPNLKTLLEEYSDIFEKPTGLPPIRTCDHRIQFQTGTDPIVVRPYRYPHLLKDEIEKQCNEMLQSGVIRRSQSPFSSAVLLVKKIRWLMGFCVDYRELNAKTIKDKFPIPVVEELLNELHGATVFTKLDLTSGYHQIRMCPTDIEKTAFRTHHGHFEFMVMPFGLSNAPSTFQSLMNDVFREQLRRYVLVFFDDILIYSHSLTEHLINLQAVFGPLRAHGLFLKKSKCSFSRKEVAYLGIVIQQNCISVDHSKIAVIRDWPKPSNVRALRGFLGLAGYYRKFIKGYGIIAVPLTSMLRRNNFEWNGESELAFVNLKEALSCSPVLALPYFTQQFIVECDASGSGIGAVLQQQGHPVAFFSRKLGDRHHKLPAYERELIGLTKVVAHWRPYLWGRIFLIKADHFSLKFLLEQRLTTSPQQHWISKLLGFDFCVEYRAGSLNQAADALSRRGDDECSSGGLFVMSTLKAEVFDMLKNEIENNSDLLDLRTRIQNGEETERWAEKDGLILYDGRAYLLPNSPLIAKIVADIHNATHEGAQKTWDRVRRDFYWKGWKASIQVYVRNCVICQQNKTETLQLAGLLQPLPIPVAIWADISMDFVDTLPKVSGKSVLFVVVDRFSKYAHFLPLSHPYTAESVARMFFSEIFRLHGLPETIVSDRDKVFKSAFWTELFRLSGTNLSFSTAYHPQSDGQTEVVNRTIEMYLRCLTRDKPRKWLSLLPWAEYCYNTSYHTTLKTTPFKLVYGRDPPRQLNYTAGSSRVDAVDHALMDRSEFLQEARGRLAEAQNRMKTLYDNHHRQLEFKERELVWLKLQPYRQLSVSRSNFTKLSPKFYGPFPVLQRIGQVAYRLQLPDGSRIHNVFHVSLLKTHHGPGPVTTVDLPPLLDGRTLLKPLKELLVQWTLGGEESATWEDRAVFSDAYPDFELEDKLNMEEGSNVTDAKYGKVYQRRSYDNLSSLLHREARLFVLTASSSNFIGPITRARSRAITDLCYKNRLVILRHSRFIPDLIREFHESASGGHSRYYRTYRRLAANIYWPGMIATCWVLICGLGFLYT
ncbi:hypothetical protein LXL04_021392 [Taraxacum kok-saghyz]